MSAGNDIFGNLSKIMKSKCSLVAIARELSCTSVYTIGSKLWVKQQEPSSNMALLWERKNWVELWITETVGKKWSDNC